MATLLKGVNEVLKLGGVIDANQEFTTLTSTTQQKHIDRALQSWREMVDQLYDTEGLSLPKQMAEADLTLATSDRDYALATDLVQLRFPLHDETNGRFIRKYPGGYEQMVNDQLVPSNYTGLPLAGAIRPTDAELYLDRIPTSDENGLVYRYRYDKDFSLTLLTDTFPFTDVVFTAMIQATFQYWQRLAQKDFDQAIFKASFGRAQRLLRQDKLPDRWTRKKASGDSQPSFLNPIP